MKTGHFLFVVTSCFLLMRATSLADDQQRALTDVGLRPDNSVNDRSLHAPRSTSRPTVKPSTTTLRNHGLAAIGGPAKASRNTAMINGTNMKRRP